MCDEVIGKCLDAMKLQQEIDQILEESLVIPSNEKTSCTPHLLVGEKNLLSLASYPDCTQGVLYAIPLILQLRGTTIFWTPIFAEGSYEIGPVRTSVLLYVRPSVRP